MIRQLSFHGFLFRTVVIYFYFFFFIQRLNTANEEIIEVLLSKRQVGHYHAQINIKHFEKFIKYNALLKYWVHSIFHFNIPSFLYFPFLQVLPALRYIRAIGAEDSASPRKFLEAATNPEDSMLFYTGMSRDY